MTTSLKIIVQPQNEPYTHGTDGIFHGGPAVSASGRFFLDLAAGSIDTLTQMFAVTQAQVEANLRSKWMVDHPLMKEGFEGYILIDCEDPHPKDLGWKLNDNGSFALDGGGNKIPSTGPERDLRIEAMKVRIRATRRVFPNAKVGQYGVLVPDGRGIADANYTAGHDALVEAGQKGMFDDLHYISPVLYCRFGPNDPASAWTAYAAMATQGVDGSRDIKRSNGQEIPLIPLMNSTINNGNSVHHREYLLDLPAPTPIDTTLGQIVGVLEAKNVREAFFWIGGNSYVIDINASPNPNEWSVGDYEVALRPAAQNAKDGMGTRKPRGSRRGL